MMTDRQLLVAFLDAERLAQPGRGDKPYGFHDMMAEQADEHAAELERRGYDVDDVRARPAHYVPDGGRRRACRK